MSYQEYRAGEILMDMRVEGAKSWAESRQKLRQLESEGSVSRSRRLSGWVSLILATLVARLSEQKEVLLRAIQREPECETC
jgi:hypothetical protein